MPRQLRKLQEFPELPRHFRKCLISAIPCNRYMSVTYSDLILSEIMSRYWTNLIHQNFIRLCICLVLSFVCLFVLLLILLWCGQCAASQNALMWLTNCFQFANLKKAFHITRIGCIWNLFISVIGFRNDPYSIISLGVHVQRPNSSCGPQAKRVWYSLSQI